MENKGLTFHFEWHSLLRDVLVNFWIVVLCVAMAFMGCYIARRTFRKPEYSCSATVVVRGASNSSAFMATKTDKEKAAMLATVLAQPSLKQKAAESLGREVFDGTLAAGVYGTTNLLSLSVTADTPEDAFLLTEAVLAVCPDFVRLIYSDVVMTVLKNPAMPLKSIEGIPSSKMALIVLATAAVGLGAVILLSMLRDTVKDEDSFHREIDAELIGTIEHEQKTKSLKEAIKDRIHKKKHGLILFNRRHRTSLHFSESFQKLAMRLSYLKRTEGHSVFAITSVAENEGKSTVTANIALALASRGHRVLLLDADTRRPALAKLLSLEMPKASEFNRYISGEITLEELKFHRYRKSSLYLGLNSHSHRDLPDAVRNERLRALVELYRNAVDFILFDTAPLSADSYVTNLCGFVDETILVVRTDAAYTAAVNDAVLSIREVGGKLCGCVLNDVWPEFSLLGQMGADESGYYNRRHYYGLRGYDRYSKYNKYGYGKYGKYGKYDKYDKYDKYSKYEKYNKYSKYERYSKYEKYDRYGRYAAYSYGDGYGKYGEMANPFEDDEKETGKEERDE